MSDQEEPGVPTPEERRPETTAESSAELAELTAERDRLMERLVRLTAEYDNYRKRITREQAEWGSRAVERLVLDLLPVIDSFDLALKAASDTVEGSPLLEGMFLVSKQLRQALRNHGVESYDSIGEPFDPNLHEAFQARPAVAGEKPGTIVEEFLKGYRLGDRTIRATKGIVAGPPAQGPGAAPAPEEE